MAQGSTSQQLLLVAEAVRIQAPSGSQGGQAGLAWRLEGVVPVDAHLARSEAWASRGVVNSSSVLGLGPDSN